MPMSNFVGRQEELNALNEIFKDSIEAGKVVLVSGKPGLGKNALISKFLEEVDEKTLTMFLDARFYEGLSPLSRIIVTIRDLLSKFQSKELSMINELLDLLNIVDNDLDSAEIRGDAPYDIFSPILNNKISTANLTMKEIQLLREIKEFLNEVSNLLSLMNFRLVIVLDHVEALNELNVKLITNMIDNLPPRIMLILIYELNDSTRELYEKLGDVLINYEMGIIELSPFTNEDISELFNKENISTTPFLIANVRERLKGNPLYITRFIKVMKNGKIQFSENNVPSIDELFKMFFEDLSDDEIETLSMLASLKDPFTEIEINNISINRELLRRFVERGIIMHENNLYSFSHFDDKIFFSSFLSNEKRNVLYESIINNLKNEIGSGPKVSFNLVLRICWYSLRLPSNESSIRLCVASARIAHDKALFLTALKLHKDALSALQKLTIEDSRFITALLHYWQGVEYLMINDEKSALKNFEKALKIFERLGKIEAVGATLYMEGILSEMKGNIKDAMKAFDESIKMFETLKNNELGKSVKIHAYLRLSKIKSKLNNVKEATDLALLALNLAYDINNKSLILMSLYEIGLIKYINGDFDEAMNTLNEALKLSYEVENMYIMSQIYFYLGLIHLGRNNLEMASENFKKSIDISREIGDKKTEALSLAQLSVVYSSMGSYTIALDLLKKAHEILLNIEDWEEISRVNYLMATVLLSLGDIDKAFDMLIEMLDASAKTGNDSVFFRSFKILLEILEEIMQKDLWTQLSKGLEKIINAYAETEAIELENFFKTLKEISMFKITKSTEHKNLIMKFYGSINSKELKNILESIITKYVPELSII